MKILGLSRQGRSKSMPQILMMDTGHSWDLEQKAIDWYQGFTTNYRRKWEFRASQIVEDFENSGHPVFKGVSPMGRGLLKKENNRVTIHYNAEYCNIDLLYRTDCSFRGSALYLWSSHQVVRNKFR